jgi:hypothetical protein
MCGQPVPTISCPTCRDVVTVNRLGIIRTHPHTGPRCPASGTLGPVPDQVDPSVLATEVVMFALDGQSYTLKLSTANARRLRKAIAPYAAAGRLRERVHGNSKRALRRDGRDRRYLRDGVA